MFECDTDRFLIYLTSANREIDPDHVLEDALEHLGRHTPMTPRQDAILTEHLHRSGSRSRADRKSICEAA